MPAAAFHVGLVQMQCDADPVINLEKAVAGIHKAAEQGAQIICLQELFQSHYFCQKQDPTLFDLAEPIPGPATEKLAQAARQTGTVVIGSLFEARAPGLYHNTAIVLDADGALLGLYRKMHIPDDPLYYEKYYFTPGDLGFKVFATRFARIGVLVCWDQWFPEGARLTAMQGADILFYPTAIGWHPSERDRYGNAQRDAWITIQRSHAIANGIFVAAVNRVGHEGDSQAGLQFWGSSFVSDPFGQIIRQAATEQDEILVATCDPAQMLETRRNWPFFRDRRIDAYGNLTQRWS